MSNKEFVSDYLSPLLKAAKNMTAEFLIWEEVNTNLPGLRFSSVVPGGEYVLVTCENGYHYLVDVTWDSLCAMAQDVLRFVAGK